MRYIVEPIFKYAEFNFAVEITLQLLSHHSSKYQDFGTSKLELLFSLLMRLGGLNLHLKGLFLYLPSYQLSIYYLEIRYS